MVVEGGNLVDEGIGLVVGFEEPVEAPFDSIHHHGPFWSGEKGCEDEGGG